MKFNRYVLAGITLLLSVCLFACGKPPAEKKAFDSAAFIEEMLSEVSFSGEITRVDDESAGFMFLLPEKTTVALYAGNGSYADELAVFTADSADDVAAVREAIQAHLDELKDSFSAYIPEEVPKIEDAIVASTDRFVILCITSDKNAASIIDRYVK